MERRTGRDYSEQREAITAQYAAALANDLGIDAAEARQQADQQASSIMQAGRRG